MTIDLTEIAPQDIVLPEKWDEYSTRRDLVHEQLMRLEISLFVLGRLFDPEVRWLLQQRREIHRSTFWDSTSEAHFAQIALATHILWNDNGIATDLSSLRRFKKVVLSLVKPEYVEPLRAVLKPLAKDAAINATITRLDKLRTGLIAHHLDGMTDSEVQKLAVTIGEVRAAVSMLRAHFEALCFGHGLSGLPIQYAGIDVQNTDIDELILSEARSHSWITMAEEIAEMWELKKKEISGDDAKHIQYWRSKLGLPKVV